MSCDKCNEADDSGKAYYFRWKTANIGLIGCPEHIKEVMDVLREAQK